MTEISKMYKIVLIINMVACFAYGVLYGFLWWFWLPQIDNIVTPPFYAQFFGGFLMCSLIWFLRIILQKVPWDKVVLFIEFMMGILGVILLYLVWEILFVYGTMSPVARTNGIVSTTVVTTLLVTNIIAFFIETGKHKE